MKYLPPLRYAMPALLVIVGLVLVLLAFFDGVRRTEQLIENEASSQMMTFGTRIAARLEQIYTGEGPGGAHDILIRTANEPHLRAAVVVDSDGRVLDSADAAVLGQTLAEFAPAEAAELAKTLSTQSAIENVDESGGNLSALFPFVMPPAPGELRSHRYAALYLRNDISEIKRLNWARHVQRAWTMIAIVAVAFAVVWLYFQWAIAKRLQRLSVAMHRVTLGDWSVVDSGVSGRDELGRLGDGFSQMFAELRQRRDALAASEERYRSVVQSMSEGVIVQRGDGTIIESNASASRILGLTEDELQGRAPLDPRWRAVHEDGTDFPLDQYPAVITLRTGKPQAGIVMGVHRRDGTLRWIAVNSEPCILEAKTDRRGSVTTFADITERRNAELRARREGERLEAIVDSAMDGVICTDGNLRITVFNHTAERIFGRTAAEMVGRSIDILLPPRYRNTHHALMQEFAGTGTSSRAMGRPGQVMGLRADGEEFPLEASITRVSVGGETVLTVMLRDISERLHAEEQRAQLEAQLRQSQKMQSLGTLTGGIAHDFNNILTAISGNAKLAIDDLPKSHPVQRSLQEIDKAATRATELVRQVLAFGRRQEAQRVVVEMESVVGDALRFLRAMIPATIEIRGNFARDLPTVAVDATQVHQVITNLGSNAAHAIGDGAGAIDVALEEVTIDSDRAAVLSDIVPGKFVRLTFADNGSGIDAAILDRIFEPFFTTKDLGQGTGLGLSVVHGIMRNHEGAIAVSSAPGKGTRFELFFPVSEETSSEEPHNDPPATAVSNSETKTIIYLDDEEALVFLVTRILERQGYKVLGFTEAKRALAELARNPQRIDAIVSDLSMPGMTGFEVAKRVRAMSPDLPVIVVSGYIRPQDLATAQSLGIRRMILKPDTVDALAAALHEVLDEAPVTNSE